MEINQPPGNGGRRDGGQENLCFFVIFCDCLSFLCFFLFFVFFLLFFMFFYVFSMFFGVVFDVLSDPQTVDHQIQGRETRILLGQAQGQWEIKFGSKRKPTIGDR